MDDIFSQDYYGQVYCNYRAQNPPAKLAFYRSLIERHRDQTMTGSVHDIGCAFGLFLDSLGNNWSVYGSDVSAVALDYAKRTQPKGQFVNKGADAFSQAGPFDAVTAWDVLEHVPDLEKTAEAIKAQLKDTGVFAFVVPVYDGPLGPIVHWLDNDPTHIHKCPRQFWLNWAQTHFELCEWQGVIRYTLPRGHYLHLPTRKLRSIAPALVVVCKSKSRV